MTSLHLMSGGAAAGLVRALEASLFAPQQLTVQGTYGAVGAMRDALLAGAPCDVLILTVPLLEALQAQGWVEAGSITPLGRVATGVAVPQAASNPPLSSPEDLRAALLSSHAIYFPDPLKATAGIHFAKVLGALGIADDVASRLRPHPNGATAMRAMAEHAQASGDTRLIGCTQVTEILYTPGVRLVAPLPPQHALETVYAAAVCAKSGALAAARQCIALMAGIDAARAREDAGFTPE